MIFKKYFSSLDKKEEHEAHLSAVRRTFWKVSLNFLILAFCIVQSEAYMI